LNRASNQSALRRRDGNGRSDGNGGQPIEPALPADELPLLLTAGEVAWLLKVSERSVWRLRSAGYLPKEVNVLGSVRWRRTDIENWVVAGCPKLDNRG